MFLTIAIRVNHLRYILPAVVLAARLSAADANPSPAARKTQETSVARQRQSIAAMAASLEAQRRALRTQQVKPPEPSFFTLPPLPPLPAPVVAFPAPVPACPPLPSSELDTLVEQAAEQQDLEPDLLRGVIRQESGARPCAVSAKGAMGLMQLMPSTATELGVGDAFDPKANVDGGARLLKQLLTLYGGDVSLALGAFNAGPGRVNQAGGVPNIPETLDYVQKILSALPVQP